MNSENIILENELIVHIFTLLKETNNSNNDILTEILNTFIFNNYSISLEVYVLLQLVLKLDINQNNKLLINCLLSKTDNNILMTMSKKCKTLIDNPFSESESKITPFSMPYEINIMNTEKSK